jgi:hypothetical protein
MGLQPYALSIHHFISSVGADAGFAAIIGLAILVLLYFAQARETASLREQAELAAQRIAQLESRLTRAVAVQPLPQPQPQPQSHPPIAQPPPSVIAAATVRPNPTFAVASNPSPPAGVAAPPLSAATKLIPTPPVQEPVIAAPGVAAARISAPGSRAPVVAAATAAATATASGPPAAATAGPATASGPPGTLPPTSPPPVNRIVTPRPATAAGGAAATNGAGERPVAAPPSPPVPLVAPRVAAGGMPILGDYGDGGKRSGRRFQVTRVLTAVAAVAVVAAIVIVLLQATSGANSPRTTQQSGPASNAPTTATHHRRPKPRTSAVNPAAVTVSVLNGTAVYHLADSIATQLGAAGFKSGTVANAATQTQSATTVEYAPGDERDAAAVQKALKLGVSSVQPMNADTQTLGCAQNPTSCSVVVTVGADLAGPGTQTNG